MMWRDVVAPLLLLCGGIASSVLLLLRGLPIVAALPYAGAVIWAIGAIAVAQRGGSTPIVVLALVLIVVLLIALIGGIAGRRDGLGARRVARPPGWLEATTQIRERAGADVS